MTKFILETILIKHNNHITQFEHKISEFLKRCYDEMCFNDFCLNFDENSVIKTIRTSIHGGYLDIIYNNGEIVGIFAAMVAPNIMDHTESRAIEYIWHTDPRLKTRRRIELMGDLLKNAIEWQKKTGIYLVVNTSENRPHVRKILEKEGFIPLETSFGRSHK